MAEESESATPTEAKCPLVLVVDDDEGIREALSDLLADAGFATVSARHGLDALNVLTELPELPTLILLDLRMPVMDGWAFCDARNRIRSLREIPIVALSAVPITEANRPAGIDAVLAKPMEVEDLASVALRLAGQMAGCRWRESIH